MEDANAMLGGSSFGVGGGGSNVPDPKLVNFATSLSKVFKASSKNPRDNKPNAEDYRVFLKEEPKNTYAGSSSRRGPSGGGSVSEKKKRVLNYWCFSPGVAMEDLKALGVRSLILTSGTLSPMDAFKEDMKVPFPVELENPHVITDDQIWISALNAGPGGSQLLSTYDKCDTNQYADELGMSILSICQNMMGGRMNDGASHPRLNGGVLVFFPSYGTMETASTRWKESGLWNQLCQVMGRVVTETQTKQVGRQW
jgi:regulator of telomere elongation helicase 1